LLATSLCYFLFFFFYFIYNLLTFWIKNYKLNFSRWNKKNAQMFTWNNIARHRSGEKRENTKNRKARVL
jgi:hypothetical protein